jgi:glycosyltransferase involved in cell wall biosynthesis
VSNVAQASRIAGSELPQPLVSVVVAAFNAAGYIEETCLSVLRQTYAPLELIVVDDGSTDETAAIVSALAARDSRIRLIRQANRGVAAARNEGIARAAGEFIAPLDADDVWDPTKIARQVRRMTESGPDTGLTYCWWAWIDAKGVLLDRSPRWQVQGHVLKELVEVNFTGSASVPLYRKSSVQAVGGYRVDLHERRCQGCEDWDLAIRIAERHTVAVVPAVLVGYRRHVASMSAQCDTMWRSQLQVMADLEARQPSLSKAALRRSKGQFALHLAGVAFWSGNYVEACRWGLRARSLTLTLSVLPHVTRILARRLFRPDSSQSLFAIGTSFDESTLPEPLIPYDRIYAQRWQARE